ncbi:hypothetical protein MJG53_017734 [Ovis ammon polii x Ovis aries]|uniref:Uncharacterized protein n=1 Tax=Ovis ammon polii x Ovis aries TaxID=2918886 RepID=A0ACB9U5N5_9CETA|nr:hypothetical protein MJG53_017734 [Ovis ammon polii x Ovis aries]
MGMPGIFSRPPAKGSLITSYERKRGSSGCGPDPRASSRVETGFLSLRCQGLKPCVESGPEPEDSSPVLTWIVGYFWSLPRGGKTSWIFSSCSRCCRITSGTSGTRSCGLRKGQSPCELLAGLWGFLTVGSRILRPCVESGPEPEDSSPVWTRILGYFWSLLSGVLKTYNGVLRDRLWWNQERPVRMRVDRELLGIPLPSLPGPKTLCGVAKGSLITSYERKRGSSGCGPDPRASSRVETGFLSLRCQGLKPCVESGPEPEDSSPVLTWIVGYFWSLPRGGKNSWIFSSCSRCCRITSGTSGTRSCGLRKGQSPCELLAGLWGFLTVGSRILRPCVESGPEPEDSSPVWTRILGYFWSLLSGVLKTYNGVLRDRLWWNQERPVRMRVDRELLGIPLPSLPGPKTLCGVGAGT